MKERGCIAGKGDDGLWVYAKDYGDCDAQENGKRKRLAHVHWPTARFLSVHGHYCADIIEDGDYAINYPYDCKPEQVGIYCTKEEKKLAYESGGEWQAD